MLGINKFSARNFDWILLAAALLLVAMGLAAIYSVDLSRGLGPVLFKKQAVAAGMGAGLLFLASLLQPSFFRSYAKLFYFFSLLLLILVLLLGQEISGTKGWFRWGAFSFQPVELAKAGVILILAYVVYNFGRRFERPLFFLGTGCLTLAAIGLVMLQPDLGSAILLGLIWLGVMLLVKTRKLFIILLLAAVTAGAIAGWFFILKPYQQDRILTFINPERDALGAGYNSNQAIIAVGSGRLVGRGLGFGSQSQLRFLPEAQTDFIFSVIAEELGFAGAAAMIVLFGILWWRLLILIRKASDDFVSVAVSGAVILIFSQFVINVGANIGLLPITGVTLPFVSYGGSSLVVSMFLIGMAEGMMGKGY